MATTNSVSNKLLFSGEDDDFAFFADQFEARMYVQKLYKVLHGKVVVTSAVDPTNNSQVAKQEREEAELADKKYKIGG